jgi:hypothetical protein
VGRALKVVVLPNACVPVKALALARLALDASAVLIGPRSTSMSIPSSTSSVTAASAAAWA